MNQQSANQRLKIYMDYLIAQGEIKNQADFGKKIGISPGAMSDILREKKGVGVSDKVKRALENSYNISLTWLEHGTGEMIKSNILNEPATPYQMPTSNAKLIGDIFETEYEDGTRFRPIGNGRFMMRVPLVTEKAKAGFLAGYADPTYIAQLPQLETIVDFQAKGNYLAFDVEGDSMDDRSIEAIPDQSRVIVRELPQHQWMPRLYHHRWKNWVFAHKTEGVIIKQIADQNLEEGWIKYTCLNPNKDLYPDKVIYLKDIQKIYNVIKRELLF